MKRKCWIFVNGILNNPMSIDGFTDECHLWCQDHDFHSVYYEYASAFISTALERPFIVKKVRDLVKRYSLEFDVHLVGHSNGCTIVTQVLDDANTIVEGLHLVAAACSPSFAHNGINEACSKDRVKMVKVFCSKNDHALALAKPGITGWIAGLVGLSCLGLVGPLEMNMIARQRTRTIWRNDLDHSEWFNDKNLDQTMEEIVRSTL